MNAFSVLLSLFVAVAFGQEFDCSEERPDCGEQTVAAAKCLTPCFTEAQQCFRTVGTQISRIQQCMLDYPNQFPGQARTNQCEDCIDRQLSAHCDEWFNNRREYCGQNEDPDETGEPDDSEKFYFRNFAAFQRFCMRLNTREECKDMGCNFTNRGGCNAARVKNEENERFGEPKVRCKRIRNRSMCNSIQGCTLRKKAPVKRSGKARICKGTARFPEDEE